MRPATPQGRREHPRLPLRQRLRRRHRERHRRLVLPRLIGWNGHPGVSGGDAGFRDAFVHHTDFGSARLEIGTASMEYQLGRASPAASPSTPPAPWS
ncbi:hypothetical protein [Nonomuraea candida]|uniref:hypothetical protein n=1 Tax=Nonomuraea candida TaxID=359159 RepID=UPI000AF4A837|nr:hypothetical protein [Nonomuraea candida]